MNSSRRRWLIGSTLVALLLAAIAWSYIYMGDQRSAALASADQAAACDRLGHTIESLRAGAAGSRSEPAQRMELTDKIAKAVADAGLPTTAVDRIEHEAPRRRQDGAPVQTPTHFVLRGATLGQLVRVMQSLDRPGLGLRVQRLHLTAPNDSSNASTWSVEATLLYQTPQVVNTPVRTARSYNSGEAQ